MIAVDVYDDYIVYDCFMLYRSAGILTFSDRPKYQTTKIIDHFYGVVMDLYYT